MKAYWKLIPWLFPWEMILKTMSQSVKKVNRYSGVLSAKSTVVMTDPAKGVWLKGSPPTVVLLSHL